MQIDKKDDHDSDRKIQKNKVNDNKEHDIRSSVYSYNSKKVSLCEVLSSDAHSPDNADDNIFSQPLSYLNKLRVI